MIRLKSIVISKMLIALMLLLFISVTETRGKNEEEEEEEEDISLLSELPFQQLLTEKKNLPEELQLLKEQVPLALPLTGESKSKMNSLKGFHNIPFKRKTFHEEDYDDDKEWMHKEPEKHHSHDILNTSLTVLSYLAFGGYLLCMIVNSLRQNNKSLMAAYPSLHGTIAPPPSMTALLQQYGAQRPIRIKFPAVTIHQGKKKRRNEMFSLIEQEIRPGNPARLRTAL